MCAGLKEYFETLGYEAINVRRSWFKNCKRQRHCRICWQTQLNFGYPIPKNCGAARG